MTRITVIGGGPGGYTAAFAAARSGAEVCLVEREALGGTCLNWGCIPTKTLKSSADALELARRMAEFGVSGTGTAQIDMPAMLARKTKVCDILRGGLEKSCAKLKVRLVHGQAQLVNASLVQVTDAAGVVTEISGDKLILATGSQCAHLPSLPLDGRYFLSSNDALQLDYVPESVLVVGGGVVGCELAFILRSFGAKVTIVEGLDRVLPLPTIDQELSRLLQREMKKHGIGCETGRTIVRSHIENGQVHAVLGPSPFAEVSETRCKESEHTFSAVLVTIGRTAAVDGLDLAKAGVDVDGRGWIQVDAHLQTSQRNIYAVGDVLGPKHVMLAHVAAMEGLCAVRNCLGTPDIMHYDCIPSGIFTSPELASVGLTEIGAKEQGFEVGTVVQQMRELGKAQAMGELAGIFKLVFDKKDGRLLGAHLAGAHATDMIAELALAITLKAGLADIAKTIHAHPTLAEGIYEAALQGLAMQA